MTNIRILMVLLLTTAIPVFADAAKLAGCGGHC